MSRLKLFMLLGLVVGSLVLSLWVFYLQPKLTLFSPDHRLHHFAHMDKVFPTNPIETGTEIHEWMVVPREIAQSYQFDGEQRERDTFLARTTSTSLLVIKQGVIVHEEYLHGYDQDSRATSFSVAKSFVATMVQIAKQEGLIDSFDDPISTYLPRLEGSGFAEVRILDILNMSSGIDFSEVYQDANADSQKIFERMFLQMQPLPDITTSYGNNSTAGQEFYYASLNTQVLAEMLIEIYGMSLSELLESKIWKPLGMAHSATWNTDLYGTELGFMALNATPRDFALFGQMLSQMGTFNGTQIVDAAWIEGIRTPEAEILQRGRIYGDWGYHQQFWLPKGADEDFAAIGIWGQMIYIHPEKQLVIVKTGADPDFHDHEVEAVALFRAIGEDLD